MPRRLFFLSTLTLLLTGCNAPDAEREAPENPGQAHAWQITNSTTLGLVWGTGFYFYSSHAPGACSLAHFRIPAGTHELEAVLSGPSMVDTTQPGAGELSLVLRAPNGTMPGTSHSERVQTRISLTDPQPGKWTAQVYGAPVVANQYATVTITMRGTGNATGTDEVRFWKDPLVWPWNDLDGGCPGAS